MIKGVIEISKEHMDAAIVAELDRLHKQIRSLESKLKNRDKEIERLRQGMDLTKERREKITALAEALKAELESAGMVYMDYGL